MDDQSQMLLEIHEMVFNLDKKLDLHIQATQQGFSTIRETDTTQNRLLAEHMARSEAIQKDVELRTGALDKRIKVLEAPRHVIRGIWRAVAYILGPIAIALDAIYHFILTIRGHR